ncbi:hypothetical protein HMPREF0973_02224 [Prevotella veroralis F0319]|uniref:Uncharacterized protein n=1 Tax=Prevotella veroralis F0319 TaxID=649761 RepID=C9MRH3_9BACT|nr:hypothetical protein HMPREF0973_02224 [Prevotella veroralis F0319]
MYGLNNPNKAKRYPRPLCPVRSSLCKGNTFIALTKILTQ